MNFLSKIFNFSRGFSQKIQTLNHIYISKEAILNNFDVIQSLNPWKSIFPVLKSNAYWHGITQVASILKERKLDYIVVDSYYEALKVWEVNPVKILLIGYMLEENLSKMNFKKIDLVVYDTQIIHALGKLRKKVNIHIKVDTGMNRQWVFPYELKDFLKVVKKYKNIQIIWVCTHLADSDNAKNEYSQMQLWRFEHALDILKSEKIFPKYVHLSNSWGSLKDFWAGSVNSVRLWVSLYGVNPLAETDTAYKKAQKLRLALDFETTLIQKKLIKKWEKVWYNGSFEAPQDMLIGVVPVGYFEALPRSLSNNYTLYFGKKPLPIIGKVCMNLCMIDLTQAPAIHVWDKISVISWDILSKNTLYHLAKKSQTIPYEVMVKLNESVRREITK